MKRQLTMVTLVTTLDTTKAMTTDAPGITDENDDDEINDAALMASIANGDRNAFNIFLSRHLIAVVLFAKRYLLTQSDAEDIAQETFFRVWQKAASWQSRGHSPRSWMYRIAYNLCIDEIRRRSTVDPAHDTNAESNRDEHAESIEQIVEKNSDIDQLVQRMKKLPERQYTALSLCALQGLSNKEAATVMGISVEAIESLLSRGRRQLRNSMQHDGESNHE